MTNQKRFRNYKKLISSQEVLTNTNSSRLLSIEAFVIRTCFSKRVQKVVYEHLYMFIESTGIECSEAFPSLSLSSWIQVVGMKREREVSVIFVIRKLRNLNWKIERKIQFNIFLSLSFFCHCMNVSCRMRIHLGSDRSFRAADMQGGRHVIHHQHASSQPGEGTFQWEPSLNSETAFSNKTLFDQLEPTRRATGFYVGIVCIYVSSLAVLDVTMSNI